MKPNRSNKPFFKPSRSIETPEYRSRLGGYLNSAEGDTGVSEIWGYLILGSL